MVCTYNFFTGGRVRRTQTGEISSLCCTEIIFTCTDENCFVPPVVVNQITQYTLYLHYNIPSDWVVHYSPSVYMDRDDWHKSMSHFSSLCCSSPLNPQLPLYDDHDIHFYDRELTILCRHDIEYFVLKPCDYLHNQPNNNGPNMKRNYLYGNARMNWRGNHGNLNFTLSHINSIFVETWEAFKLSSATINQKHFKKTRLLPISLT